MERKLFSPYTIKDVTFKNRIVMSPMCMNSSTNQDGKITKWHILHYGNRAVGQVGLIMLEGTAVSAEGRITYEDLGIWNDEHVEGLKQLVDIIHEQGSKVGIQLAHAGRKSQLNEMSIAPSVIAFERMKEPKEMTEEDIQMVIHNFKEAARRAKEAGFDVVEIHAGHGYLINQFLSPLTNHRTDQYGSNLEKRYFFLEKVIQAIKQEWRGPLFTRISATEYHEKGNTPDTYVVYAKKMKEQGVDLIDCTSGGVVRAPIDVYPGYQVPAADQIRNQANIATGAVGLITTGIQAEEILKNNRADLIFIGRELLRNPYWPRTAAQELNVIIDTPDPYKNYGASWFPAK
ncbi:NADPH dehydrogenase NamA [Aneurinibacillus tyrosinisolvens]|uniref:NADPH dehydrogenase NamA n=1 Tax=Aneurinibacillus tyrosinisolvens TaxID=1443435 RepID=UPI00063FC269|nr:NADPH dehydrogenase NamA [Aneurinibacillus tyrosinisolvens]